MNYFHCNFTLMYKGTSFDSPQYNSPLTDALRCRLRAATHHWARTYYVVTRNTRFYQLPWGILMGFEKLRHVWILYFGPWDVKQRSVLCSGVHISWFSSWNTSIVFILTYSQQTRLQILSIISARVITCRMLQSCITKLYEHQQFGGSLSSGNLSHTLKKKIISCRLKIYQIIDNPISCRKKQLTIKWSHEHKKKNYTCSEISLIFFSDDSLYAIVNK